MISEAEVSNAESKGKNQLRPSKQRIPSLKLALLCQADFKRGVTREKTWSLGRCMLGEFEFLKRGRFVLEIREGICNGRFGLLPFAIGVGIQDLKFCSRLKRLKNLG